MKRAPTMQRDRRPLVGVLIFSTLLLLCFVLALAMLRQDDAFMGRGDGPRIGVIEISGPISEARRVLEDLRRFRKSESIEAVVMRIDSPGGAVGPSQEIFREIRKTRKHKPVVASLGAVAASGGYYIAAGCSRIVSSPGTITGSIGVITHTTEVTELLRMARVRTEVLKTGRFKDTGSPLRPLTDEDRALLQGLIDGIHAQFVGDVSDARNMDKQAVSAVADGRILTGQDAKELKLVDELGNLSDALASAAKLAKAKGDPVAVYPPERGGLLHRLMDDGAETFASRLRTVLRSGLSVEVRDSRLR